MQQICLTVEWLSCALAVYMGGWNDDIFTDIMMSWHGSVLSGGDSGIGGHLWHEECANWAAGGKGHFLRLAMGLISALFG